MTVKLGPILLIEIVLVLAGIWVAGVGYGYLRAVQHLQPKVQALAADVDNLAAVCGQVP